MRRPSVPLTQMWINDVEHNMAQPDLADAASARRRPKRGVRSRPA